MIRPTTLPTKEHSGTSENSRLFPKNWRKMEHVDVKDGSRLCLKFEEGHFSGNVRQLAK
jgi:hypothetical protein